jgi:hypothetical protein
MLTIKGIVLKHINIFMALCPFNSLPVNSYLVQLTLNNLKNNLDKMFFQIIMWILKHELNQL